MIRQYSALDHICLKIDQTLRTLFGESERTDRPSPAEEYREPALSLEERQQIGRLMRVNHTGEVCAQALYHAQSISSRNEAIRATMQQAAIEEGDHLAWCKTRLDELGTHTSYLNPLWYAGSFAIGITAGMVGDAWNLGFLAETEKQVVEHLDRHLKKLPPCDEKSYAILQQMQTDEQHHHDEAMLSGAKELPLLIKQLMRITSALMVKTAYWI